MMKSYWDCCRRRCLAPVVPVTVPVAVIDNAPFPKFLTLIPSVWPVTVAALIVNAPPLFEA